MKEDLTPLAKLGTIIRHMELHPAGRSPHSGYYGVENPPQLTSFDQEVNPYLHVNPAMFTALPFVGVNKSPRIGLNDPNRIPIPQQSTPTPTGTTIPTGIRAIDGNPTIQAIIRKLGL